MELLDQYLRSVKPLLPEAQRQDILDELSEEIGSQMEEKARTLGRPLTSAEQEEILGRFGHPLVVGGRYQANQGTLSFGREIIGRELFPFYVRALKVLLTVTAAMVVGVMLVLSNWEPVTLGSVLNTIGIQIVVQGAVVTAGFAYVQSAVRRNPGKWDIFTVEPKPVDRSSPTAVRWDAITQLVALTVILPWIHGAFWPRHLRIGPGELTALWHNAYWPLVGSTVAAMAFYAAVLVKPDFARLRAFVRIAGTVIWLITALYLLQSGPWVVAVDLGKAKEVAALNSVLFRNGLLIATWTFAGVLLCELAILAVRAWRRAHEA
jgi:hypothetical protein